MHTRTRIGLVMALIGAPLAGARADRLAGSPSSMVHQHDIAMKEEYRFLRTPKDVQALTSAGELVAVTDNENLTLSKVSYPFARPEVRGFVERFAAIYRDSTGTRLVVTSLTRPASTQPANAHKLSVHPAGMAVDLRVPSDSASRAFLERSLLEMERAGVLDVTREHTPAHYHIAVFAEAFTPWAARRDSVVVVEQARVAEAARASAARSAIAPARPPDERGRSVPRFVFGLLALVGMTAPAMYRASRPSIR